MDNDIINTFIILLVNANNEPIEGRLKFQKMMFVLSDIFQDVNKASNFYPYKYWPFSQVVDNKLGDLIENNVLTNIIDDIGITEEGKKTAEKITKDMDKSIIKSINECKDFFNNLTFDEVLSYIYSAYPNMVKESVYYHNIKSNMEYHIMSLLEKEKISIGRAAELLKIPIIDIIRKINDKKLQILH